MRKCAQVSWKDSTATATGKMESIYKESITCKQKGHDITRHGTANNLALVIVHDKAT